MRDLWHALKEFGGSLRFNTTFEGGKKSNYEGNLMSLKTDTQNRECNIEKTKTGSSTIFV